MRTESLRDGSSLPGPVLGVGHQMTGVLGEAPQEGRGKGFAVRVRAALRAGGERRIQVQQMVVN